MSWLALVLCAQLAAPATRVQPVLSFPDKDLDDAASYRGYQTRLFRDASGNTIQIYLDERANRVVHLWADAENESLGFTAPGAAGKSVALRWGSPTALVTRSKTSRTVEHALVASESHIHLGWFLLGSMRVERDFQHFNRQQAAFATGPAELSELTLLIHEEALGGQAVRESASEYVALISESSRLATTGRRAAADSLVVRARSVLGNVRRTRENHHMIDAEFQFPIVVARWIGNPQLSAARKRAFLLDARDSGEPRLDRLLRELALVARITAPYATNPIAMNLISFAPRDSGRWGSQSWRDSGVGYAGGRFAMDVNAIWVPHALEAVGQILGALRSIGISPDSIARVRPEFGAETPLGRYARDAGSLGRDVKTWRGASHHFLVRLAPSEVRERVNARLAAMTTEERSLWSARIPSASEGADTLAFLALSLDQAGQPIAVANTDVATRLFLGDDEGARRAPSAQSRAETLRDVRLIARSYPIGLLVDGVGPVVANDAYAAPSVWRAFDLDRYHSPRVVWGRENNLFLTGAMKKLADANGASTERDPALVSYRRELRDAIGRVSAAVEASGFRSELWSYEVRNGRAVPMRYGSGSDVQLWSTTDLVVQFERSRLAR